MIVTGENSSTKKKKREHVPNFPPKISHELTWDPNEARLT